MATPRRFLAAASIAVGLVGGGVAGVVLGVPGVSGAQTTTVPEPESPTTAPDSDRSGPDRPGHDRRNCPDKDGEAPAEPGPDQPPVTGSSADLAFREAPGGGDRI